MCFETNNSFNNSHTTFIACMRNIGQDTLNLYVDVVWECGIIVMIRKKDDCVHMLKMGVTSVPTGNSNSKIMGMSSAMTLHYGETARTYLVKAFKLRSEPG